MTDNTLPEEAVRALEFYANLPKEWTINAGGGLTYGDLYLLGERARAALAALRSSVPDAPREPSVEDLARLMIQTLPHPDRPKGYDPEFLRRVRYEMTVILGAERAALAKETDDDEPR